MQVQSRDRKGAVGNQKQLRGPALVVDYGSTTLVPTGWRYSLDKFGNLKITS